MGYCFKNFPITVSVAPRTLLLACYFLSKKSENVNIDGLKQIYCIADPKLVRFTVFLGKYMLANARV